MNRKLPTDAFDFYFSLGPGRSYQLVAEKYGVHRRTVTALAGREGWQARIVELERRARERTDTKVVETIEAMQQRHLKSLQAVLGRVLEVLCAMPLSSAMEAVRAIEMVIRQERLVRGEPTDRAALEVEELIRREYDRWLEKDAGGSDGAPAK
ncbi:MAG: hypothetical protein IPJ77_24395 [Planctomycetes bacterium]|nr:hypothetical protein [Planctomycetota bacterium]